MLFLRCDAASSAHLVVYAHISQIVLTDGGEGGLGYRAII